VDWTRSIVCPVMAPKHTPQKWLEMRPYIGQLYVVEDKTLKEVRQIMRTEHGFEASERMYKQRLRDWDMQSKNLQKPEWRALDAIQKDRKLREGKETVFYVNKRGKVHRKVKSDIEKHYKRDDKVLLLPQEALNGVPRGITIQWHTPNGSPASTPRLQQMALPQMPTGANMPTDEQSGMPFIQSPSRSNQAMSSPPSPEPSPLVRPMSSPSLSGSSPSAYSDPDTSVTPSPSVSVEDLISGFQGLALKLNNPDKCHISKEDELKYNRMLSDATNFQPAQSARLARLPQVTRRGSNFALEFDALDEHVLVASEWAASIFMACYWMGQDQLQQSQSCRQEAMRLFTRMLRHANDNVHTGLSWLVSIIGSHGHFALLKDFLADCCETIDSEVGANPTFSPLYRYTLAMVSEDQPNILRYGNLLNNCHNTIRGIWGRESPNFLISSYYLAYHCLHSGDVSQAVSRLEECLPLSEQLMGKNHLVTINCMSMLHRAYFDQGHVPRAISILVDAVNRCEPALGKQSPFRLELLTQLALEHKHIGQTDIALRILHEVLEDQIKLMGFLSKRTWWTIDELGRWLIEQGQVGEAEALHAEMLRRYHEAWNRRNNQDRINSA